MLKNLLVLTLASFAFGQEDDIPTNATVKDDEMGPAGFMWPPDRPWAGDVDNKGPCGSRASSGNRTNFPLTGGAVSLVAQDDYYNTKISISYSEDPDSGKKYHRSQPRSHLRSSSRCPSKVSAGDNATLQIIYRADWDAPHNQTFYACADITFVKESELNFEIPCFNATEPGDDDKAAGATVGPSPTATHPSTSSESSDASEAESKSGKSNKLSGGAIAGIVIGSIAGVVLIAGAILFFLRRSQQAKRNSRIARMEDNARKHQLATDGASGTSI
ncbi:gpi-anchored protein [Fusarium oxysporum f. sp. phaseoli]